MYVHASPNYGGQVLGIFTGNGVLTTNSNIYQPGWWISSTPTVVYYLTTNCTGTATYVTAQNPAYYATAAGSANSPVLIKNQVFWTGSGNGLFVYSSATPDTATVATSSYQDQYGHCISSSSQQLLIQVTSVPLGWDVATSLPWSIATQ